MTSQHNELFGRAAGLLEPHLVIDGVMLTPLTTSAREAIHEAQLLFSQVVVINPGNWAAFWLLGKSHERLGEHEAALDYFARAYTIKPDHPDVAREATIAAIRCSRFALAIQFAIAATQAAPEDAGLLANLALAHLVGENPHAARSFIQQALSADPQDATTLRLAAVIDDVLAGTRTCPTRLRDVDA
jgi:Flp pilus assembly protein TadD